MTRKPAMQPHSIKLSDEHTKYLRKLGNGSIIRGLRLVVDNAIRNDFTQNQGKIYAELTYVDPFRRTIVRKLSDSEVDNSGDESEEPIPDSESASESRPD